MEMESPQTFPTVPFKTGVKMEQRHLTWTIENFHVVLQHDSLLEAQEIEFSAGATIGLESKWCVKLGCDEEDGKKWAGIYFNLRERPALKSEFLFAQCAFKVKNEAGRTTFKQETTVKDMYDMSHSSGWGFTFVEREEEDLDSVDETLTIHITFTLYSPSAITHSVEGAVADFSKESHLTALQCSNVGLLQQPGSLVDIQILSNDSKLFTAKKEILSARSPVFEAMLKTPMTEGKEGVIKISDLSSKTLGVLLQYICVGGLHKDWMESDVLVELTNAAAKYQLPKLLNFLDGVVGRVCDVENAGPLLTLANRLSLKQAEKDLLSFVRIHGTESSETFFKIVNTMSVATMEEPLQEQEDKEHNSGGGNIPGGVQGTDNDCHPSSSSIADLLDRINTIRRGREQGNAKDGDESPPKKKKKQDE